MIVVSVAVTGRSALCGADVLTDGLLALTVDMSDVDV